MIKQIILMTALLSFMTGAFGEEKIEKTAPIEISSPSSQSTHRTYFFGTLSMTPGIGLCHRYRKGHVGFSGDLQVGTLPPLPFLSQHFSPPFPLISANAFLYVIEPKKSSFSPYVSCGAGIDIIQDLNVYTFPVRMGLEGKIGFIDAGAVRMMFYESFIDKSPAFVWSPEIRGGLSLRF